MRTSAKKRSRRTGSEPRARGRNFSATGCPSFKSSARYTSPMPPLPRSPMIRYRSTRTAPGAKPPAGIESDDARRPIGAEGIADGIAEGSLAATVGICDSDAVEWPQDGQNRALAGISVEQEGQSIGESLVQSWLVGDFEL